MNTQKQAVFLDKEELHIESELAKGNYVSSPRKKETKMLFEEAARYHKQLKLSKSITIRVNQEDLIRVKAKAKRNEIPYQTLLNTLIHQYATDQTRIEL